MFFKKTMPAEPLRKYVANYWVVKEEGYRVVREINPSSNISVCFHFGHDANYTLVTQDFWDGQKRSFSTVLKKLDETKFFFRNVIIGPHRSMMIENSDNGTFTLGIEFKTGFHKRFLGADVVGLVNNAVPIDASNAILFGLAAELPKKQVENLFDTVDKYLIERYVPLVSSTIEDHKLIGLMDDVSARPFDYNVKSMSIKYNSSKRTFERIFKQYVGLSPKQFVSVKRIDKVCQHIKKHPESTLVEILESCGYYDQAHINRDFKMIGGFPEAQILANFRNHLASSPDILCVSNSEEFGVCGINLLA